MKIEEALAVLDGNRWLVITGKQARAFHRASVRSVAVRRKRNETLTGMVVRLAEKYVAASEQRHRMTPDEKFAASLGITLEER